jgi:hypothetical protein
MLVKIGAALALVALTTPAFAQSLGGFDIEGNRRGGRNIPPQYRMAPNRTYGTTPTTPSVNPSAGQIRTSPPPSAYGSTYNNTYGSTYGGSGPGGR